MQLSRTRFYSLQEILKNHHHNTLYIIFNFLLKRNNASLYLFDYITKLYHYFQKVIGSYIGCCITLQIIKKITFLPGIRMNGKSIKFGDEKVNKNNFYKNKKTF